MTMCEKIRPLDIIFMSVLTILFIGLFGIATIFSKENMPISNNYINTADWTEKCTQYEYYGYYELNYNIKTIDELTCNFNYRACLVINNLDITCKQQKLNCVEQYSNPY